MLQVLTYIVTLIQNHIYNAKILVMKGVEFLESYPDIKLDYLEIVDYNDLQIIEEVNNKCIIAVAIFIGNTRLIDNIIYKTE